MGDVTRGEGSAGLGGSITIWPEPDGNTSVTRFTSLHALSVWLLSVRDVLAIIWGS
jgi:hypothetical protein